MNNYRNEDWLRQQYVTMGLNAHDLGKKCGVSHQTILKWLRKFNIRIKSKSEIRKGKYLGENNFAWKGGRFIDNQGYIHVYKPEHPNAQRGGYILEHRLIMSNQLGRPLSAYEIVHHIDGNKGSNNIKNLLLTNKEKHKKNYAVAYKEGYGRGFASSFFLFALLNMRMKKQPKFGNGYNED